MQGVGLSEVAVEPAPADVEPGLPDQVSVASGAGDGGAAALRDDRRRESRLARGPDAGDQGVADPVAVEVGGRAERLHRHEGRVLGRVEPPERPPGFGPLAPEGAELALVGAPEVHEAVAVQVGRVDLVESQEGLGLAARGGLEHVGRRRIGVGGPLALNPSELGILAVEREGQERPAVRAAAPPLGPRQGRRLVGRDRDVPPPERPAVLAGERLGVDPLGLGRAPLIGVGRRPAEEDRHGHEVAAAVVVQVGRLEDGRQAVLPLRVGAHGSDPSRPAG